MLRVGSGFAPLFLVFRAEKMADNQAITQKIMGLVEPIVREEFLELVDVELHSSGKRWALRIYIDKEGGVTIGDCERISREVGRTLDVEEVIDHPYTLEVSSPGLTRPLKKKRDFERYAGKMVRVITSSLLDDRNDFRGEIGSVTEEEVEIRVKMDIYRIPFCAIKKAHLEFDL
jgi:ribosome maturation factor RimP